MHAAPGDPLADRLAADLAREGLTSACFAVLVRLAGDCNAAEVPAPLERRGLVERAPDGARLTPLGRELVDRLFPEHRTHGIGRAGRDAGRARRGRSLAA